MSGAGRLNRQASNERSYLKNKEWYDTRRKINYRKQKIKQFLKEIKELEEKEVKRK